MWTEKRGERKGRGGEEEGGERGRNEETSQLFLSVLKLLFIYINAGQGIVCGRTDVQTRLTNSKQIHNFIEINTV